MSNEKNTKIEFLGKFINFKKVAVILTIAVIGIGALYIRDYSYHFGFKDGKAQIDKEIASGFAIIDDWSKLDDYLHTYQQFNVKFKSVTDTQLEFECGKIGSNNLVTKKITLLNGWKFKMVNLFLPIIMIEKDTNGTKKKATMFLSNQLPTDISKANDGGKKYYISEEIPAFINENNGDFEALKSATPERKIFIFAINQQNAAGVIDKILKVED